MSHALASLRRLAPRLSLAWGWLRAAAGDDAYERYHAHCEREHPEQPPLSRRAFYEEAQRRKWSGVSRCC